MVAPLVAPVVAPVVLLPVADVRLPVPDVEPVVPVVPDTPPEVGPVVVVVVVVAAQAGGVVMVLASRETSPLRARTRPWTVAPESRVAEVSAMMVPTKVLPDASVAELPTCQNTLQAWAPFSNCTTLSDAVTRSDDAWKTNTELASPSPLRTSGLAAVMLAVAACPKA